MSKVGQGPRGRDLLPDLDDLLVLRVTTGQAVASHAHAVPGEPRLGPRVPVLLMQRDLDRPAIDCRHGRSPSSGCWCCWTAAQGDTSILRSTRIAGEGPDVPPGRFLPAGPAESQARSGTASRPGG